MNKFGWNLKELIIICKNDKSLDDRREC